MWFMGCVTESLIPFYITDVGLRAPEALGAPAVVAKGNQYFEKYLLYLEILKHFSVV